MDNITIVTGLWNIKRDELSEGWSRTFEHYLEKFNQYKFYFGCSITLDKFSKYIRPQLIIKDVMKID